MPKTSVQQLAEFGQSVWLDYISRPLMKTGKLQGMIDLGLRGMTSNPSIFNEAIGTRNDYDNEIVRLSEAGKLPFEIYDALTIEDIQRATDIFLPVYKKTNFLDGYVSLEINPKLAMKTKESIEEGVRLFKKVNRPNVMIKVPATSAGFPVIEELLAQGINVNVTLIFSLEQYEHTAAMFFKGMNRLMHSKGADLNKTHSVASVFVSRVDTAVDQLLDERLTKENNQSQKAKLQSLKGTAAVANCQLIFEKFNTMFSGGVFKVLAAKNCPAQRVLWASTGTKNPQYSDIKYVAELISKPTVNTLPEKTIDAFLDHGVVKNAIENDVTDAKKVISALNDFGINVDQICAKLQADGVAAFEKSFESLLTSIETKARQLCAK